MSGNAAADVTTVHWYVNGNFYQSAAPNERVFFVPQMGNNTVTCVDDKGRQQSVNIAVKFL